MTRITPRLVNMVCLGLLSIPSISAVADTQLDDHYVTSKPLMLEVRYCDCAVVHMDNASSGLLPRFLNESDRLRVGVSSTDKGFVSSRDFEFGYEIKPDTDRSGSFVFDYASAYRGSAGENASEAKLLLTTGEWVPLSWSHRRTENGEQSFGIAVRLAESP